ncbi:MAG: hypothetical protein LEGION0398_MBIBDBAK_00455 [Legionellaceae bacterium]
MSQKGSQKWRHYRISLVQQGTLIFKNDSLDQTVDTSISKAEELLNKISGYNFSTLVNKEDPNINFYKRITPEQAVSENDFVISTEEKRLLFQLIKQLNEIKEAREIFRPKVDKENNKRIKKKQKGELALEREINILIDNCLNGHNSKDELIEKLFLAKKNYPFLYKKIRGMSQGIAATKNFELQSGSDSFVLNSLSKVTNGIQSVYTFFCNTDAKDKLLKECDEKINEIEKTQRIISQSTTNQNTAENEISIFNLSNDENVINFNQAMQEVKRRK